MRIVSVLPSATEIVCALGAEQELLGRSEECDFPASVASLPVVMRPRILDRDRPSGEIDRRVREARGRGESLYRMDVALLQRLRPEVLLTQDLCGVCSVTEEEVKEACAAAGVEPTIVSLAPRTLDEVWTSIETIGEAIGRGKEARVLASRLRARARPSAPVPSALTAIVEWLDPPILAGLWTPSIVRAAGATAIGPDPGEPGRRTTWPEILEARPDLVVVSPCSFPVARTISELQDRALSVQLARLTPNRGVFLADEAYFSRPGPRLADGIDLVRDLLSARESGFPMPVSRYLASAGPEAA